MPGFESSPPCPACASPATRRLVPLAVPLGAGRVLGTHIWACRACNHRFLQTSDEEQRQIEALYGHDYRGYVADPVFAARVRELIAACIAPRQRPPARVLDVGCGNGEFLVAAKERGYDAQGIDVSEAAAAMVRGRGVPARAADFLTADLGAAFDVITMWDVVEHLRAPSAFLARARALLAPGGILVLKIPGFGRLTFPPIAIYPRVASIVLGAPTHVQYFSQESLDRLVRRCGFGRLDWLPTGGLRQKVRGGSLRKRVGRALARTISTVAKNETLFVVASL